MSPVKNHGLRDRSLSKIFTISNNQHIHGHLKQTTQRIEIINAWDINSLQPTIYRLNTGQPQISLNISGCLIRGSHDIVYSFRCFRFIDHRIHLTHLIFTQYNLWTNRASSHTLSLHAAVRAGCKKVTSELFKFRSVPRFINGIFSKIYGPAFLLVIKTAGKELHIRCDIGRPPRRFTGVQRTEI